MYKSYTRRPLETTEYELLPKELELQETALQKLRRLMYEVQELNEQVEKSQVCYLAWMHRAIDQYFNVCSIALRSL